MSSNNLFHLVCSNEVFIGVKIVIVSCSVPNNVIQFDFVAKEAANATETLAELVAVGALVRDELNVDSIFLVVQAEPVSQLLARDDFQVDARLFVLEILRVLLLLRIQKVHLDFILYRVLNLVPHHLDILEEHHSLKGSQLERFHGVIHTKANVASVEGDFFEELANDFLLLHKFDVGKRILSKLNGLIEALIETVRDVNSAQNETQETLVKAI